MTEATPAFGSGSAAGVLQIDDLQIAVSLHDAQGRLVGLNASARELLLAPGASEDEALVFFAEDGAQLAPSQHPVARVLETRRHVRHVTVGARHAGATKWLLVDAGPCLDANGAIERVVASYVDITERRKVEEALRDSEIRYRTLFESMDAAVLLMRGAECIDCNAATLDLFGAQCREEILGKTPLDFAPEYQPNGMRSVDMVQQNVELALRNGTHAFEWLSSRVTGEPLYLDVRFTPFALGDGDVFQCIAIDISERKAAEEALRKSEARFRAIIEHATEGVLVADASTKAIRYANPEACRMFGYALEDLVLLRVGDIHPPDALDVVRHSLERDARSELQSTCLRSDGTEFQATIRSVPADIDRTPCVVGFFKDETAARLLDEEREKTQRLEALGTLAGGIAHDFNNLLQGVFGFISVAKEMNNRPEVCLSMLEQAESALQRTISLTTQLLTFSRGGSPVKRPLQLQGAVANTARFALSGSRATLHVEHEDDLWAVEADEGQIGQVVQNVVLNAAQSMSTGGNVTIALRNVGDSDPCRPPQLAPGEYVAIAVRDEGEGIAPELVPRIFDPYFTTKPKGSGLGLATSYSIIKSHGGFIDVTSELGRGSTFTIYLPSVGWKAEPQVVPPAAERLALARVLVMDDDAMVRKSVAALLGALGHQVELAEHGEAAIAKYGDAHRAARPFDLVILDLTVRGGMGGLDTLESLRVIDPCVRAIVSSGYSDDASLSQFREHGFSAALNKPYSIDDLRRTLADVLCQRAP